jgi:hypothetical protein
MCLSSSNGYLGRLRCRVWNRPVGTPEGGREPSDWAACCGDRPVSAVIRGRPVSAGRLRPKGRGRAAWGVGGRVACGGQRARTATFSPCSNGAQSGPFLRIVRIIYVVGPLRQVPLRRVVP